MPAPIHDEFSALSVSKQRKSQLRNLRDGKCIRCGRPRMTYAQHCDACHARVKARLGHQPWQPGRPGRPPFTAQLPAA